MLDGVARAPDGLVIDVLELLLGDIAVIALQLLLGAELNAEIRELAFAPLAVLAGAIFAEVDRAFRPAPDILAVTAVDLVLRLCALCHPKVLVYQWVSALLCQAFQGLADREVEKRLELPRVARKTSAGPNGPAKRQGHSPDRSRCQILPDVGIEADGTQNRLQRRRPGLAGRQQCPAAARAVIPAHHGCHMTGDRRRRIDPFHRPRRQPLETPDQKGKVGAGEHDDIGALARSFRRKPVRSRRKSASSATASPRMKASASDASRAEPTSRTSQLPANSAISARV